MWLFDLFRKRKTEEQKHTYEEYDTECDLCNCREECYEKDFLLDCTICADSRSHYIRGLGVECKKYDFRKK